jgi:hypothetical protein
MNTSIQTLVDLLTRSQFHAGLIAGAAVLAVPRALRLPKGTIGWGLGVCVATMAGVYVTMGRRLVMTVGLVLLVLGGWMIHRSRTDANVRARQPMAWVLIVLGATVVTVRGGLPGTPWIQLLAPLAIIAFGYWIASWGSNTHRHLLGPLFAISAFGVWTTVPDTDSARVLIGVALPMLLATLPFSDLRISSIGAYPLAAIVVWAAATGGEPRHGSIIGAWGCFGLLAILPWLHDNGADTPRWLIMTMHSLLVLLASRLFGLWESAAYAAFGVGAISALAYTILTSVRFDPAQMGSGNDRN